MFSWKSLAYLCADTFVCPFDLSLFLLCLSFFLTDTATGLFFISTFVLKYFEGDLACVCFPAW